MQTSTSGENKPTGNRSQPSSHIDTVGSWCWLPSDVTLSILTIGDVLLYLLKGEPLPSTLDWADEVLSAEEHARAERFVFDLHRNRYRFRRAALRHVLAAAQNVQPTDIRFANNAWGKPLWANRQHCNPFHFNLSHSGDAVAIATSPRQPVGVDIEQHRNLPEIHSMARMVMHPVELGNWLALPEESQPSWFFNLWSLKEAALKCVGCGLALEPASFCVDPAAPLDADQAIHLRDPNDAGWAMQSRLIDSFNGFSMAICVTETKTTSSDDLFRRS